MSEELREAIRLAIQGNGRLLIGRDDKQAADAVLSVITPILEAKDERFNDLADYYHQQLTLSWDKLPNIEISSFSPNATIYHPKLNLIDKIKDFFKNLNRKF